MLRFELFLEVIQFAGGTQSAGSGVLAATRQGVEGFLSRFSPHKAAAHLGLITTSMCLQERAPILSKQNPNTA